MTTAVATVLPGPWPAHHSQPTDVSEPLVSGFSWDDTDQSWANWVAATTIITAAGAIAGFAAGLYLVYRRVVKR